MYFNVSVTLNSEQYPTYDPETFLADLRRIFGDVIATAEIEG